MSLKHSQTFRRWLVIAVLALSLNLSWTAAAEDAPKTWRDWQPDTRERAAAADENGEYRVPHDSLRKLGRGITNMVFGCFELPFAIVEVNKDHGGFAAITWGVLLGFDRWGMREHQGFLEFSFYKHPDTIIIEPEFPFDGSLDSRWRIRHMEENF